MPPKRKYNKKKKSPITEYSSECDILIKKEYPSPFTQVDSAVPGCSYQDVPSNISLPVQEEDSEITVKEEFTASGEPAYPSFPGCSYQNKSSQEKLSDDLEERYQYVVRHRIDYKRVNPDLLVTATVTTYKELEFRWDFDGEYHHEMKAYGIFYVSKNERIRKKLDDNVRIRKKEFRLLGIVKAVPLPMKVRIKFDHHPFWCGEMHFSVRYQDSKEGLGPFSRPVTCLFKPSASDIKVAMTVTSKFDFSGSDPITDADGVPFTPL